MLATMRRPLPLEQVSAPARPRAQLLTRTGLVVLALLGAGVLAAVLLAGN